MSPLKTRKLKIKKSSISMKMIDFANEKRDYMMI